MMEFPIAVEANTGNLNSNANSSSNIPTAGPNTTPVEDDNFDEGKSPRVVGQGIPIPIPSDELEEDMPRRERDYYQHFGHLNEKLIEHYSCACKLESDLMLRHGRMFLSEHHICFSSHIIDSYIKVIPFKDILAIEKQKTAFVIPNAIQVTTSDHSKYFFTSFFERDKTFQMLETLWMAEKMRLGLQKAESQKPKKNANKLPNVRSKQSTDSEEEFDEEEETEGSEADERSESIGDVSISAKKGTSKESVKDDEKKKPEDGGDEKQVPKPEEEVDMPPIGAFIAPLTCPMALQETLPCTLKEFIKHFFAEGQEFWFETCKESGNFDLTHTGWSKTTQYWEREVNFRVNLNNPLAPKSTKVIQTLKMCRLDEKTLYFRGSNSSPEAPYGDAFTVDTLWDVKELNQQLTIKFYPTVTFSRSVWVKGMITNASVDGAKAFFSLWVKRAKDRLSQIRKEKEDAAKAGDASKDKQPSTSMMKKRLKRKKIIKKDNLPPTETPQMPTAPESPQPSPSEATANELFQLLGFSITASTLIALGVILILFSGIFYTQVRVWSLHGEVQHWKNSYNQLEDRIIFLQNFAYRLSNNITQGSCIGESEWDFWKKSRGIEFEILKWKSEIKRLEKTVSDAVAETNSLMEEISDKRLGQKGILGAISDRHLDQIIEDRLVTDRVTYVKDEKEGSSWIYFILYHAFFFFICMGIITLWPIVRSLIGL